MKRTIILCVLLLPAVAQGAITGKIMGRVSDARSGKPLPFANVILQNTMLGAITNENGDYFVINIPPGEYTVKVQMMGYSTAIRKGVQVDAGRTVFMNFTLEETVIELKDVVTVKAARPLIEPGVTHSARIYASREIERIPRAYSALRLLEVQPEITKDFALEEYHMRGGRGGEILYLVDGVPVNDRFVGGSAAMDIPVFEVKQVEILKGGFETEYGEAQSGIINLITKPPDTTMSLDASYRTDRIQDQWNTDILNFSLSNPLPVVNRYVLLQITAFGDFSDTHTPFGYPHHSRKVAEISFADRQENDYGFSAKVLVRPIKNSRLVFSARSSRNIYEKYRHQFVEIPDHTYRYRKESSLYSVSWNQSIGRSSFYELKFATFATRYHYDPGVAPPEMYLVEEDYLWAEDNGIPWAVDDRGIATDVDNDWFFEIGFDSTYHTHEETNNSLLFDFVKQFENKHLLKCGFEHHFWRLKKEEIELLWYYDSLRIDEEGPYPGYGWSRDVYDVRPQQGGIYLQDKYEREGLTLNYGLRYDYFYVGKDIDVEKHFQGYFSPRIGFFYPLTDRIVFTFSYGFYYQMPEYQYIFMTTRWRGPDRLIGNPELRPECTRAYEFKVQNALPMNAAFSFAIYKKDIRDLVNAELVGQYPLESYKVTNSSYGDAMGLEFECKKPFGEHFTGRAIYILSWATGRNTKDLEKFDDLELPDLMQEYPLSWDERHRFKVISSYQTASDTAPGIAGMTAIWTYGSGLPYSLIEEIKKGTLAKNSERLPAHATLDIELFKRMTMRSAKLTLSFIIENVFDKRNVVKPDLDFVYSGVRDPSSRSKPRTILMELELDL
jgi:outer membrane receptor protein involved in Fe transport